MKRLLSLLTLLILLFAPMTTASAVDTLCGSWSTSNGSYICNTPDTPCYNGGQPISSPVCRQDAQQNYNVKNSDLVNSNPVAGPNSVLQTVTNVMALLTGIVAVIMIIVSAFQFITAGGNFAGQRAGDNPSKAKKARANIVSASIGLVVVALSWTIVTFIIQHFVK